MPLILVSNDDGVYSQGIAVLAEAMRTLGRVVIVAPTRQQSASSHALTLHRPLRIVHVDDSRDIYAVDGTPTDAVTLALKFILKEAPALVVSGINDGANLGDDIHYSGTVAAALEGSLMGVPSIAFSLAAKEALQLDTAAVYAQSIARMVLDQGLGARVVLNVNIPNIPLAEVKGLQWTIQGKRNYGDIIVENRDPRGKPYYWIGGNQWDYHDIPGSDCNAVREGYVSVTPIKTYMTDAEALVSLKQWNCDVVPSK